MTATKYVGYVDPKDLPIRKGDFVRIPKGALVKIVGQDPRPAGRSYVVRIDHVLPGVGYPPGHPEHDPRLNAHLNGDSCNPKVVWPGTGGYWAEADINDVQKVPPSEVSDRLKARRART